MHYNFNADLSRIDIISDGQTVAFITAAYFNYYPYFNTLLNNLIF